MPKRSCHGLAAVHCMSVCQLATRPERICSVAEKNNWPETVSRSQYMAAMAGKIFESRKAPASTQAERIAATRPSGTRRRLIQTSTAQATATLITDPRENESTNAAKNNAPPNNSSLRETGESRRGREKATAIITRKNAQKLPSVLAS